ncbi:PAS domain-containing protein [Myxococcus sp. CA051A]|nr:PAS domain-containing protein [Myxococcus sp. CA051A]
MMHEGDASAARVGDLLAGWESELRARYVRRVERERGPRGLAESRLVEMLPVLLEALTRALWEARVPPSPAMLHALRVGQAERWQERPDADVGLLAREYGLFHDCLLELLEEVGARASLRELRIVEAVLAEATADAVSRHSANSHMHDDGAWLQAIIDHAPPVIFAKDAQGRFVLVNRSFEEALGIPRSRILGRTDYGLFPFDVAHSNREHDARVRDTHAPLMADEYIPGVKGVRTWFAMKFPLPGGARPDGPFVCGISTDITDIRRTNAARDFLLEAGRVLSGSLELEATLRSLAGLVVAHLSDYCTVDLLDGEGKLVRLEAAAREPSRQELIRRIMPYAPRVDVDTPLSRALARAEALAVPQVTPDWLESVSTNAAHRALLEALSPRSSALVPLVSRGRALGLIHLVWTRPHAPAEMEALVELARGAADRAAVAIENARLYREAREAVRVREDVVAIVSHDLRNPLNAIHLTATALLRRAGLSEEGVKGIGRIRDATQRATRMIRDLLDFTQARVGERIPIRPRPMDLHGLIRQAVDELLLAHPQRHVHVELHGDGRLDADEDRLAQVVTNLVGNALQHSEPGSLVRVVLRQEEEGVCLEVHNAGAPIPPDLLPTLFEPYRRGPEARTNKGSIGLGLYISRQIVLGHGGRIDVDSAEEGTRFRVWLPRPVEPGLRPERWGIHPSGTP